MLIRPPHIIPSTDVHLSGQLLCPPLRKAVERLIKLARHHNIQSAGPAETVGLLTGYDTRLLKDRPGGSCNGNLRVIALSDDRDGDEMVRLILHETGHALQFEHERFEVLQGLFSEQVFLEWQAESIACHLYNGIYGYAPPTDFDCYFSYADLQWLKDYYGEWMQDDFLYTLKPTNATR